MTIHRTILAAAAALAAAGLNAMIFLSPDAAVSAGSVSKSAAIIRHAFCIRQYS